MIQLLCSTPLSSSLKLPFPGSCAKLPAAQAERQMRHSTALRQVPRIALQETSRALRRDQGLLIRRIKSAIVIAGLGDRFQSHLLSVPCLNRSGCNDVKGHGERALV